jgi:hypothetical protein
VRARCVLQAPPLGATSRHRRPLSQATYAMSAIIDDCHKPTPERMLVHNMRDHVRHPSGRCGSPATRLDITVDAADVQRCAGGTSVWEKI